ncbi:membrane dipeptidase [Bacillus mesophilus]|uniref:Membrane dipeptidase n=1 Tax=Bacillus mesophilus TaxID=1808955 RepID=A0A6M0Q1M5_9BACI|nr:dipeptidase [Bacillus mesophilus]MBM7659283.1 membrane dipeptidase [Bacillus mesophilus]NEY70157.1 membrane dipeptidase [Bacillus mesophilus]
MKIFDAHCDVLYKLWLNPTLRFEDSKELHITFERLKNGQGKVQCMAIYVPEEVPYQERFEVALEMVNILYEKILPLYPSLKLVKTKQDIKALKEDEIGILLTLEGCDAIGTSISRLKTLFHLGVKSVGLTWNYSNAVADGILEPRGAGLSLFGKKVVQENNRFKVWTDVSHLSIKGFWEVIELADYPIASHSNALTLCNHPRNLNDDQLIALIKKDSMIGINFVPYFLAEKPEATIKDVIKHIDYICSLGGERNIGFGSDFDGISQTVIGLEHFGKYEQLVEELYKHFTTQQITNFCYKNFCDHLPE